MLFLDIEHYLVMRSIFKLIAVDTILVVRIFLLNLFSRAI